MLTLSDTALNDNQVIWLVKIDADTTIKLASKDITLSSNAWDGQVVLDDSLSDGGKAIDTSYGGGIGSVGSFELSIARYNFNALTDGFHTEFYPDSGGVYLTSRVVHIGFLWEGATTEAEITWFFYGYIDEYSYDADKITLTCLEYAELENIELPYYKVQKEFDNGISYFLNAPEPNKGASIPIVYGGFTTYTGRTKDFILTPALLVDKSSLKYVIASHPFETTSVGWIDASQYGMALYISELDNYMVMHKTADTSTENTIFHTITLMSALSQVYGQMYLPFNMTSTYSDTANLNNIIDQDNSTYVQIDDTEKLALRIADADTSVNIGALGSSSAIGILFYVSSNDANNRTMTLNYRNQNLGTPTNGAGANYTHTTGVTQSNATWNMAADNTGKQTSDLPWNINEILNLEFYIENTTTGAGNYIKVFYGYVVLEYILINKASRSTSYTGRDYNIRNGGIR